MHDQEHDSPLDGALRQAVDAVKAEPVPAEAVERVVERAVMIPTTQRPSRFARSRLVILVSIAASLLVCSLALLSWHAAEPRPLTSAVWVAVLNPSDGGVIGNDWTGGNDSPVATAEPTGWERHSVGDRAPASPVATSAPSGGMPGRSDATRMRLGAGGGIDGDRAVRDAPDVAKRPEAEGAPLPLPPPPLVAKPEPAKKDKDRRVLANQQLAGLLTAGSFDDNLHPEVFDAFLKKLDGHRSLDEYLTRLKKHRLVCSVKNADGQPIGNARVVISDARQNSVELRTRTDGSALFLAAWDKLSLDGDVQVAVTTPDGQVTRQKLPKFARHAEVLVQQAKARAIKNLDLALIIDTTGSMGDELEYLKKEIDGIAAAIHARFPEVNQRYALILYRDTGDEYVVRKFDFMPKLADFRKQLEAQSANGGGDEPEALHAALETATKLEWREDADTARVAFLVADAPPHGEHMAQAFKALDRLRKQAIAVYPIACSGYTPECELVMRVGALLTGSRFLFLTDDSGVGNAHAEPNISHYHVEKLNQLMIRMMESELAGKRIPVKAENIIRTVGKPDQFDREAEPKRE